jgi:hypothetical protein
VGWFGTRKRRQSDRLDCSLGDNDPLGFHSGVGADRLGDSVFDNDGSVEGSHTASRSDICRDRSKPRATWASAESELNEKRRQSGEERGRTGQIIDQSRGADEVYGECIGCKCESNRRRNGGRQTHESPSLPAKHSEQDVIFLSPLDVQASRQV